MKTETKITVFTDKEAGAWMIDQIESLVRDNFYTFPHHAQRRGHVEYRVKVTVERVE